MNAPQTRVCYRCRRRKRLTEFHLNRTCRGGRETVCKRCRAIAGRAVRRPCDRCGSLTRGNPYCNPCRYAVRAEAIAVQLAQPQGPGPKVCGLPMHGGWCPEALQFGVNRAGYTVVWCVRHGERLMPRGDQVGQPAVVRGGPASRPTADDEEAA